MDAEGIRKINEITLGNRESKEKRDTESVERILELERQRAEAQAKQQSEVNIVQARQADGVTLCVSPPTVIPPCFVGVRVVYPWSTITAWPLVPNSGAFYRTTTMRTFY